MTLAPAIAATAAGFALLGAGLSPAHAAAEASSRKIVNVLSAARPLAASEGQFLEAALKEPARGSCEALSPDPGFVEEMLLDVDRLKRDGTRRYEHRVALVVGNGAYEAVSTLKNPATDAAAMAKMFRALGFTVYRAVDATEKALDDCFARFKSDLEQSDARGEKADIALFFYAGHGLQLTSAIDNEKRNYMLAVDATVDAAGKAKGFRQVDKVLTEMRAHSNQAVFLYDACRNAPYREGAVKEADGQAVRAADASAGPASIDAEESERASQAGLFIAYATSPGKTADDAWGPDGSAHSPFTEALLKNLPTPGVVIEQALVTAYYDVGLLTGGRQTPWTSSSLQSPMRVNGASTRSDTRVRSSEFAAQAALARARGFRGLALGAALKGLPPEWSAAPSAPLFAGARAELYRALDTQDVRFERHRGRILSAALSADYRRLATASEDGTTKIWSLGTGALLHTLSGHEGMIYDAAFSPDGALAATASSDKTARLWDGATGAPKGILSGHRDHVTAVAFSPDGRLVATASWDRTAKVWDARTGSLVRTLEGHSAFVNQVAFTPDGKRLLTTSSERTAKLWNAETGALIRTIGDPFNPVSEMRLSPDGRRLLAVSNAVVGEALSTAKVFEIETGKVVQTLAGHQLPVGRALYSADGRRIVTMDGVAAKVWDAATGALVRSVGRSDDPALEAALSADGAELATIGNDVVSLWNADSGELLETVRRRVESEYLIGPTLLGDKLLAIEEQTAALIDLRTGPIQSRDLHPRAISAIAISPDQTVVATASPDKDAALWKPQSGTAPKFLHGHLNEVTRIVFSPNGKLVATASTDNTARLWDVKSGALLKSLEGHEGSVTDIAFLKAGARLVSTSDDGAARIWDVASGKLLTTLTGHKEGILDVAVSADGLLIATASRDETAIVWDLAAGAPSITISGHSDVVSSVAFSPDGGRLVTGSWDGTVKLWNAQTGALVASHEGPEENGGVAFSPDGTMLATKFSETIVLVSAADATLLQTLAGHTEGIENFAFSSDGGRLATASADGTARLWDVGTGEELKSMNHGSVVSDISFFGDGRRLATGSWDGVARIWDAGLYGPELLEAADALLTDEQRAEVERERIRYWEVDPALVQ